MVQCFLLSAVFTALAYIPVRIAIARHHSPDPEMILMLGGGHDRSEFTARFSQEHLHLKVWLSSAGNRAPEAFHRAQISTGQVLFDDRAQDTVTNFTTVADDLERLGIRHVYLITSDYHLARSQAIAILVLGSRGITFTAVPVPGNRPTENTAKIFRDVGRSVLWLLTGRTGASLRAFLKD
jgi:uncharacterized SAM-binding protein YcdF (DUF218 family)